MTLGVFASFHEEPSFSLHAFVEIWSKWCLDSDKLAGTMMFRQVHSTFAADVEVLQNDVETDTAMSQAFILQEDFSPGRLKIMCQTYLRFVVTHVWIFMPVSHAHSSWSDSRSRGDWRKSLLKRKSLRQRKRKSFRSRGELGCFG